MAGKAKHRERSHKTWRAQAQGFGYYMGKSWAVARERQTSVQNKSLLASLSKAVDRVGQGIRGAAKNKEAS